MLDWLIKIIKKQFPKYETKKDLREKIKWLECSNLQNVQVHTVERDVIKLTSVLEFNGLDTPIEYLKKEIRRRLADKFENFIEYNVEDSVSHNSKRLTAVIYIANRR